MDNNSKILLNFLESILGKSKYTSKGNYSFKCPNNCHPTKHKLEIDINTDEKGNNPWNCWICGSKDGFRGKKIISLLKKIGVNKSKIDEFKLILTPGHKIEYKEDIVELPKEFIPLTDINNISQYNLIVAKHVIRFLKSRGLNKEDIIKYNLGFCPSGKFENRIIIPSYDQHGKLNYFTGRVWDDEIEPHYKNPLINKDIIGFEYFINWNLPIILCEGAFDAMSIKRNVIPLFGKEILPKLMTKIVSSEVKKIYIALDQDAQENSLKWAETIMNYGKQVYIVNLGDKDPNKIGFENFFNIIHDIKSPLNFQELFKLKLSI